MLETSTHNRRAPLRLPTALLLLVLAVAFGAAPWVAEAYLLDGSQGFPLDDSWIHLAFARDLATGGGLSINPGELVAGTTGAVVDRAGLPGRVAAGERPGVHEDPRPGVPPGRGGVDPGPGATARAGGRALRPRGGPDPRHRLAGVVGGLGDGDPDLRLPVARRDRAPPPGAGRSGSATAVVRPLRPVGARPARGPGAGRRGGGGSLSALAAPSGRRARPGRRWSAPVATARHGSRPGRSRLPAGRRLLPVDRRLAAADDPGGEDRRGSGLHLPDVHYLHWSAGVLFALPAVDDRARAGRRGGDDPPARQEWGHRAGPGPAAGALAGRLAARLLLPDAGRAIRCSATSAATSFPCCRWWSSSAAWVSSPWLGSCFQERVPAERARSGAGWRWRRVAVLVVPTLASWRAAVGPLRAQRRRRRSRATWRWPAGSPSGCRRRR